MLEQGTCDGDALAFTTAQAKDLFGTFVADAHHFERCPGFLYFTPREKTEKRSAVREPPQCAHQDVFERGQVSHQPQLLGNIADQRA
jgi:hypothetical protein